MSDTALTIELVERVIDRLMDDRLEYDIDAHYTGDDRSDAAIRQWLDDLVYDAETNLTQMTRRDGIVIYREITAPSTWRHAHELRPHLYWTYDADTAEAHWESEEDVEAPVTWLITGHIAEESIDWFSSLVINANPAIEMETEVCLLPDCIPSIIRSEIRR